MLILPARITIPTLAIIALSRCWCERYYPTRTNWWTRHAILPLNRTIRRPMMKWEIGRFTFSAQPENYPTRTNWWTRHAILPLNRTIHRPMMKWEIGRLLFLHNLKMASHEILTKSNAYDICVYILIYIQCIFTQSATSREGSAFFCFRANLYLVSYLPDSGWHETQV